MAVALMLIGTISKSLVPMILELHHPREEDLRVLTVGRAPQDMAPNLHLPRIVPFDTRRIWS